MQIPTLITKSVTDESLTCGIAIPLPIAVDIKSSLLRISTVSSEAFLTCGAVARLFANSTRASLFVEWFKKNVPANFEEITYDNSEPFESIKQIVAKAEDAENIFKRTGKRTILYIQDMDKLLTDEESKESRQMISRFKQFVEHCSERYHTTVLLTTDYPLDEFEDASIASHRFETQIMLKDGIKPKQKTELKELQKEKERLNKATTTLDKYFWWENDDYYDDSSSTNDSGWHTWGDEEDWRVRM